MPRRAVCFGPNGRRGGRRRRFIAPLVGARGFARVRVHPRSLKKFGHEREERRGREGDDEEEHVYRVARDPAPRPNFQMRHRSSVLDRRVPHPAHSLARGAARRPRPRPRVRPSSARARSFSRPRARPRARDRATRDTRLACDDATQCASAEASHRITEAEVSNGLHLTGEPSGRQIW